MITRTPELNPFVILQRLAPPAAFMAALLLTGCGSSDAEQVSTTPRASVSAQETPAPSATPNTLTSPGAPSTEAADPSKKPQGVTSSTKPEAIPQTTETQKVTIEAMEAMDYREFEKLDNPSKLAWRFSVMNNQEFVEEGKRWDLQKSNHGKTPDYYKPDALGQLYENNYAVVKPSLTNTPQQILDLDNLALRYGVWFIRDDQRNIDHNKLNKFINTQFYDAKPGTETYEHYQTLVESTSVFVAPTNITNALRTGAKTGKIVNKSFGKDKVVLPTMQFPVDFWLNRTPDFSADVTYVFVSEEGNSTWQRASVKVLE